MTALAILQFVMRGAPVRTFHCPRHVPCALAPLPIFTSAWHERAATGAATHGVEHRAPVACARLPTRW